MKKRDSEAGVSRFQLGSWISLLCILGLVLPLSASSRMFGVRPPPPDGYSYGVQTVGDMGIAQTVDEIMTRQAVAEQSPIPPHMMREHEVDREGLPTNPDSPAVSTWPDTADARFHSPSPSTPQTPSTSFTGATLADTGAFPPDTMGAVGPSQYVVFVNGRIRTFNKTTGVADGVINANPDVFFASVMTPVAPPVVLNFTSDPNVRYDRLSGRWFMSIIDVPCTNASCTTLAPNRWLVAVSDAASGGTITGGTVWTFFFFTTDAANFDDYPSLGIDANALYTGGNMFSPAGSFVGTNGYVIRKSSVLGAGPIVVTTFANLLVSGVGPFAPRGVDNYDPAATEGYFIGVDNATFGTLMMRRVATPGGTPTISANISIAVSTTQFPIPVAHLGNTGGNNGRLDALDDRLFAAHIRGGRLWTSHNIGVNASGVAISSGTTKRDGVRWYELTVPSGAGTPTVNQSGTIFNNAVDVTTAIQYWIPSVTVSGQGHAAFGFSIGGTTVHADAGTVGRLASDTLGTVETIQNLTSTGTAYNPASDPGGASGRRWGDYSIVSLDPLDDMTMWSIHEFCSATNSYGVRVVKLLAPPPAAPASTNQPGGVAAGQSSVNVIVTGTSSTGSAFFDPGANLAAPALPFTHVSASVSGSVTVNSVTFTDATHVTLNISTVGASTGAQNIQVCNPDAQCATGTGILTINAAPPTATNTPTNTPTPTNTATNTPTSTNTPTPTFTPTLTPTPTPTTPGPTSTPTSTPTPTPTPVVTPALVVPAALSVDAGSTGSTTSNTNQVLDPGERVVVKPSWMNTGGAATGAFTGAASSPSGPAGASYTVPVAASAYTSINSGSTGDCGSNCYEFAVSNPAVRPAAHWDASVVDTVTAPGSPKTWVLHVGGSFTDSPSNGQYRFIETLLHKGVTGGCGVGLFCPASNVSRQQMAIFLLISKDTSSYTPPACVTPVFADVPCSSPFAPWINELSNRNVTAGCSPGAYCPLSDVTRAQMAVFLLKTLNGSSYVPPPCVTQMFNDVPCSSGFAPFINQLAVQGITAGCGGGDFCLNQPVTRGQMAVFLTVTFGLKLYGP